MARSGPVRQVPFDKLRINRAGPSTPLRVNRGVRPVYLILPNEANFSECWRVWIGLRDKVLGVQMCHFDTWLRLSKRSQNWVRFGPSRLLWRAVDAGFRLADAKGLPCPQAGLPSKDGATTKRVLWTRFWLSMTRRIFGGAFHRNLASDTLRKRTEKFHIAKRLEVS